VDLLPVGLPEVLVVHNSKLETWQQLVQVINEAAVGIRNELERML
jgi:hypothetical protein